MNATLPPLNYSVVKMGPNGSCLDYLCFGECTNRTCTFKHDPNAGIASARAIQVASKLGPAYQAYDAANT